MAKKSLGYVELEWVCPVCDTRNPGSRRTCQGCGSPQPPDVEFIAPGEANIATDEETARKATAGPDIHCPYCDARNPADAKVCKQCGGDLTQGEVRQAGEVVDSFSTTAAAPIVCTTCGTENPASRTTCQSCGAPLPTPNRAPKPAPAAEAKSGPSCIMIAAGAFALLIIGIFVAMMFRGGGERTTQIGTVVDSRWTRTVEVMALRPREYVDWLDEIPADATLGVCTDEVRREVSEPISNTREVCGTPYAVDQGTGFAEVVQDCVYQVLEPQCEYTVNEWQPIDILTEQGAGINPIWPALTQQQSEGQQREGEREEEYQCIFTANDQEYVYTTRSFSKYQQCVPGATWNIVTNEAGRVISAEPAE